LSFQIVGHVASSSILVLRRSVSEITAVKASYFRGKIFKSVSLSYPIFFNFFVLIQRSKNQGCPNPVISSEGEISFFFKELDLSVTEPVLSHVQVFELPTFFLSSRTDVRDLVVKWVNKDKGKISPCSRNDKRRSEDGFLMEPVLR
jgi:hypothetical protein